MPHALLRVLASTSMVTAVLIAVPPPADALTPVGRTQPAAIRPVPAVEEPPPASVEVPSRPSPAVRAMGKGPVGPEPPEVTTPAGAGLVEEIAKRAAERQEAQGFGGGVPDPDALLPGTAQAAALTLIRPPSGVAG
ncbi:MAG: hypothetical protein HOW71_11590, partial [Nonomuraea sp.]|nr:hypothetical protein [Nonomuraea sp.]